MMTTKPSAAGTVHPFGELIKTGCERVALDTFGGRMHMEWDQNAEVSSMGLLPYFVDFLKTANLFDPWVRVIQGFPDPPLKFRVLSGRL
ncbi:MAG: hypothetical protein COT18_03700 [Elusimicrobia bacterium CG08_land_8_20_14_0_20_59_10]|nr:MAG: hypothetical protein COT18_03700 [Elusimicrobia bacterium CG08_land_8_20_14_0_20_59_10]